jgi:hypothetical protein
MDLTALNLRELLMLKHCVEALTLKELKKWTKIITLERVMGGPDQDRQTIASDEEAMAKVTNINSG